MNLQKEFYKKLDSDKIKINWNKNPIKMNLFLSFLKIDVQRCKNFLGSSTGWTKLINNEYNLIIGGGIIKSIEYLDNLQFGAKLDNIYNNYVNPFYLFNVLSNDGKIFFVAYYKDEIYNILKKSDQEVKDLRQQLKKTKKLNDQLHAEATRLFS